MIILKRKRILFIVMVIALSVFTYVTTDSIFFRNDTVETVALPATNKVVILDAGHRRTREKGYLIEVLKESNLCSIEIIKLEVAKINCSFYYFVKIFQVKGVNFMHLTENLKTSLTRLHESAKWLLDRDGIIEPKHLEEFLYKLEKRRFEIYDDTKVINRWNEYGEVCEEIDITNIAGEKYKTSYENGTLKITIPDKLPNLKYKPSYTQSIIVKNLINSCKQYEKLFYNDFVIVIVKIFEKTKEWDADNRTIKPIQDGLVHAGVIKDDSIFNSCYMVQGFNSEENYIEVSVTKADKIVSLINNFIDENTNEKWQKNHTKSGKNLLQKFCRF